VGPERLSLEIATPERRVLALDVDEVVLPGVEGSFGVLYGHAPLLAQLDVGEISYRVGAERKYLAASGGFAEVLRGGVTVLAETAEPAEEIDLPRARRAEERAAEQLRADLSEVEFRRAEVALKKALRRIETAGRA
jgi:F-type H+-transporting ATPase subunit epsilon